MGKSRGVASKKAIDRQMVALERELQGSKNDLERVRVYNKMDYIMDQEISVWDKMMIDNAELNTREQLEFDALYEKEVKNLTAVKEMIDKHRALILESAKEIFDARARSHQPNSYCKYVSPEPN